MDGWLCLILLMTSHKLSSGGMKMSRLALVEEPGNLSFLNTMPSKLTCLYEGRPKPTITWLTESSSVVKDIKAVRSAIGNELLFNAFQPLQYDKSVHNAKYRCKVSSTVGTVVSREIQVTAFIDKRYSPMVHHQTSAIGGSAIFACDIPRASFKCVNVLAWLITYPGGAKTRLVLNGMSIDGLHALTTGHLVVSDVMKLHELYQFSCISRNSLNNVTLTSSAALLFTSAPTTFPPTNFVHPANVVIFAGETIILNCQATSYPFPFYIWYKDGVKLRISGRVQTITGGSIKILRSTIQDQGSYMCSIQYKISFKKLSTNVTIKVPLKITERPKLIITSTGEITTFTCQSTGTGPRNIEWRRNGILLTQSNRLKIDSVSLLISPVVSSDEGIYQCAIRNAYNEVQASARLIVDATLPIIESSPSSTNIKVGSVVTLSCQCNGQPTPKVIWLLDGKVIKDLSNDVSIVNSKGTNGPVLSSIRLQNIKTSRAGIYTCVASNRVGYEQARAAVNVEGKPSIVDFQKKVYGVTGKRVYIHCNGKGYPHVQHSWFKNGLPVQTNDRTTLHSNGTIVIKRFSARDTGKYWCIVNNSYGTIQEVADVLVLDPPQITPFHLRPVLVGKKNAQYLCTSQGEEESLKITWYKDGTPASEIEGVRIMEIISAKVLVFQTVESIHGGRYTCVVQNQLGKVSYSADFVVYERPKFEVTPLDTTVLNAHPLVLPCSATGFPQPQITWYKKTNGMKYPVKLDHRIKQLNNGTLLIGVSQASDGGKYICEATFFDKKLLPHPITKGALVEVRVPARIIGSSNREVRQKKSKAVSMFCSTSGTPLLYLKWFKNGVVITEGTNMRYRIYNSLRPTSTPAVLNSTIYINSLIHSDGGQYECIATNSYGSNKVRFTLLVEDKPEKPELIEETAATSRSISIKWKPGFNGNSVILSYRLEIKEASKRWNMGKYFIIHNNVSKYVVLGLLPGMGYSFRMSAKNKHGDSKKSNEYTLATKEEAPSAPPRNVSVSAVARDKILVQWMPPEQPKRHGFITNYRIFYTPTSTLADRRNITTILSRQFVLLHLLQFKTYRIQIQAETSAGGGPLSPIQSTTTLEGVPSSQPTSVYVQAVNSETILVSWKPVPATRINGILRGYKVIYCDVSDTKSVLSKSVNGLQAQLSNLKKFTEYKIHVLAYTNAGDGKKSDAVYKRTLEDVPGKPFDFNVVPASPSEILVSWQPPTNRNGIILNYVLYYKELGSSANNRFKINRDKTTHMLRYLTIGKQYVVWMKAKTSKGEGESTTRKYSTTRDHVPANIITPSGWTLTTKEGSDITLPCVAVGHPKPSITWYKPNPTSTDAREKRWMATDKPLKLFNVQESGAGAYNCTAVNGYGRDWNVVTLVVQVRPSSPTNIEAKLINQFSINVTWLPGSNGHSTIYRHHVYYAIKGIHSDWTKTVVHGNKHWFVVANISNSVAYFKVASENHVGVGEFVSTYKFVISGNYIDVFSNSRGFPVVSALSINSIRQVLQPILISVVVLATIILLLLLIAAWDRDERRIKKPACKRLLCVCRRQRDFRDDPYGEPGMPWPWNIKSNRYSDGFEYMDTELLQASDEQLEFKYKDIRKISDGTLNRRFDSHLGNSVSYEQAAVPAVRYTAEQINNVYNSKNNNCSRNRNNSVPPNDPYERKFEQPEVRHNHYDNEPSLVEKYLKSQEEYEPKKFKTDDPRDSILTEDSIDLPNFENRTYNDTRGAADGKSTQHTPPDYYDYVKGINGPRVLLRGESPSKHDKRIKINRKSLDSLMLKTVENSELQQVLANQAAMPGDEMHLSIPEAASIIKEMLGNTSHSYDSISSTCSSSVGELKRAFEFGKKYGLQDYQIPVFLTDSEDEVELDYQAHERLLNAIDIANFTERPRDSNDIKVQIPLPVRLAQSLEDDLNNESEDEEIAIQLQEEDLSQKLSLV